MVVYQSGNQFSPLLLPTDSLEEAPFRPRQPGSSIHFLLSGVIFPPRLCSIQGLNSARYERSEDGQGTPRRVVLYLVYHVLIFEDMTE